MNGKQSKMLRRIEGYNKLYTKKWFKSLTHIQKGKLTKAFKDGLRDGFENVIKGLPQPGQKYA